MGRDLMRKGTIRMYYLELNWRPSHCQPLHFQTDLYWHTSLLSTWGQVPRHNCCPEQLATVLLPDQTHQCVRFWSLIWAVANASEVIGKKTQNKTNQSKTKEKLVVEKSMEIPRKIVFKIVITS